MAGRATVLFLLLFVVLQAEGFSATPRELSLRLYRRLAGVPLSLSDPRLAQMEAHVARGDFKSAATIATEDPNFYRLTLKQWATRLSNKDESPFPVLNDFSAMVIGAARDGMDARLLLAGNFGYHAPKAGYSNTRGVGDNLHYEKLEEQRTDLKKELEIVKPQWPGFRHSAGLLTSRAWAEAHYSDGTNRRAVEFAIKEFLCTPMVAWKEAGLPDRFVGRDVDRRPGGNPENFQMQCRTCHAGMDAMRGAFARFDFKSGKLIDFGTTVADKMNRNGNVYPEGYVTMDDSWETPDTSNHRQLFGWRGPTNGRGIREFGKLLANSERFKSCMAEKAFRELCGRDANASEREKEIPVIARKFEDGGFKLRSLFEDVATVPSCLGQEDQPVEASIGNFRQIYETLIATTGVDPLKKTEIAKYYAEAVTRLPRSGSVEEMNSTSLLAITALSGMFCKEWVTAPETLTQEQWNETAVRYAKVFWQREPSAEEMTVLSGLGKELDQESLDGKSLSVADKLITLCTAVSSSLEAMTR